MLLVTLSITLASLAGDASILDGHWTGAVTRDGAFQRLEFDLHADGDKLTGTYDVPELGLRREPVRELVFEGDKLVLRFLYGTFDTELHRDVDEITGTNAKWGPPVRLHLKRAESRPVCRYEEMRWKSAGFELAGTLVLPANVARAPAIIVLAGSSPQGRADGDSAWTYRSWGEIAAEHGVAALVFDKRGIGQSTGDWRVASFDDQASDVLAALEILTKHPSIDAKRIGLLGISQGGWVAPIAATRDPRIAFLVLDCGPSVSVRQQQIDYLESTLRDENAVESDVREAVEYTNAMFDTAYGRRPWSELVPLTAAAAKKPWAKWVDVPATIEDLDWWKRHEFDPVDVLPRVRCPVLALFGGADGLVPAQKNQARFEELFDRGQNRSVTYRTFEGVGHGCEVPRRLTGDDWNWPSSFWVWPKRASGFYAAIFEWIEKRR